MTEHESLKSRIGFVEEWRPTLPGYAEYQKECVAIINEQQALLREALEGFNLIAINPNPDIESAHQANKYIAMACVEKLKAAVE